MNDRILFIPYMYMPATADRPAEPASYVMTQEDVVRFLRIEGVKNLYRTLMRYRNEG